MPVYKVQAPNGKIYDVEGPENADENKLFAVVQQQVKSEELEKMRRESAGFFETFGSAAARGAGQLASTFTDIIPAAVGSAFGFEDYAKEQLKEAEEKRVAREAKYPTLFRSYKEIEGIGDFAKYATETVGEQLANIATSFVPGVGAGVLAGRSAATGLAKGFATQAAERGLAGEAAEQAIAAGLRGASPEIAKATLRGQVAGAYLGSYALNAPEVFENIYEETKELAPGAAALFGSVSAALDAILPAQLARQIAGPTKAAIVGKVLEKSGMEKGLARSITMGVLKGTAGEGLTEGAQEAISIAAERFVNDNPGVFGSKEWDRIVESAVKGAVAGGAFGGVGGGVKGLRDRAETKRRAAEEAERDGKLDEAERLQREADEAETAYLEGLNRQAEAEQARQQQFEGYQQELTQMQLPGMETAYDTTAPTPVIPEPEVKAPKVKQAEMFTAEGELTPQMEKLAAKDQKAVEKRQKEIEAQFKKDQQELKTRLEELTPPKNLVSLAQTPPQLQQTVLQAQEDLDALSKKRGVVPTPPASPTPTSPALTTPTPPAAPATAPVTLETIQKIDDPVAFGKLLGIGRSAVILKADGPLAGLDVSTPEGASAAKQVLDLYASDKNRSGKIVNAVTDYITTRLDPVIAKGVPDATRTDIEAGGESVGVSGEGVGRAAPAPVEPVERGGVDVAPSDVGQSAVREAPQPGALETAPTEVTPTEAAPEPTAPKEVSPEVKETFAQIDDEVDQLLSERAGSAYAEAGLDPDIVAGKRYKGTEAHNALRIPRLVSEYTTLQQAVGTEQETAAKERMREIRDVLQRSSPDALSFLQQFQTLPPARQDQILSALNQNVLNQFDSTVNAEIAEVKAQRAKEAPVEVERREPTAREKRRELIKTAAEKVQFVGLPGRKVTPQDKKQIDNFVNDYFEKYRLTTGKKLFLPKYEGPAFDDKQRSLAESGDVNGLLRNLLDSIQDPAIKQVLRRIRSLNLKTKLEIGDPTGALNLESPAFRAWFEDSKVVDAQGKPLVVYHGTDKDIYAFKASREGAYGAGIYATPNRERASGYAIESAEGDKRAEGATVYPVYVSIKNPLEIVANRQVDALVKLGVSQDKAETMFDRAFEEYGNLRNEIKSRAVKAGHDGIIVRDKNGEISEVIAFSPDQVKSAIGSKYSRGMAGILESPNAGSYDPITNTITLDPNNGLNAHTFIHEALHAAISNVLANRNHPLTKQFEKFFITIQDRLGAAYGATDLQEFAAELVSNPSFQAVLKSIKAPKSENMFVRVLRSIAEFFGFPQGTAFDKGLNFINDALDITSDVPATAAQRLFLGDGKNQSQVVQAIAEAQPSLTGKTIESTKNFLSNLSGSDVQKLAFGLLRLDNIYNLYKQELPSIKTLLDALEKRVGTEEKAIAHASENFKRFAKIQKLHPAAMRALNDLAINISDAQVDVLKSAFEPRVIDPKRWAEMTQRQKDEFDMVEAQRKRDYNALKPRYEALPKEVKELYKTIRNDYDAAFNRYRAILEKAAEGSPAVLAKLREEFTLKQPLIGYVPYRRFGDYWLEFIDPDTDMPVAMAFESIRERDQFAANELKGIPSQKYEKLENIAFSQDNIPPTHFLNSVVKKLRDEQASDAQINSVYQAYLAAFPAESVAKQFIKRTGKRGMERDIIRGYNDLMVRWARKLANSEYIPQIDRALSQIAQEGQAYQKKSPDGAPAVGAAVQNILGQTEFFHNPTYGTLVSGATQLSFFEFMAGNISSALINLTSLPLMVYPLLTGKFGWADVMPAMGSAMAEAKNNWGATAKYKKLYETLDAHGQLRHTMAREVLEARRQKSEDYTGLKARIMDGLAYPFSVSERWNRATTAIAAFNLAVKQGMNEQQAIDYALETVKTAHTSGMAVTGPRWMQAPLGRIFFTFKSFIWNSAYVLARAFYQSFKGENPKVREAAQRQLLATYGMATVFTGVKGMPFYGAISVLAEMLASMFGDDDEPFDFNEFMRNVFGDFLYKGAFNYITNLEVANRAGLATDLIFRDDPRGVAEHGYVLSAMQQAFGPVGAIAVNSGRAVEMFKDGHYERSLEAIAPSFIRNGVKGARFLREGALTLKGDPIDEDINAYNSLMQVVGFAPADLSNRYEMLQMAKGFERQVELRRRDTLRLYDIAVRSGDSDLMDEVRERIQSFNEKHPKYRITQDSLNRSIRARQAAEKDMIYGVRFNKNLRGEITERFFEE